MTFVPLTENAQMYPHQLHIQYKQSVQRRIMQIVLFVNDAVVEKLLTYYHNRYVLVVDRFFHEPENPTRTLCIFPNPKNPNPKNLKISKPEHDKTRKLKKFQNPKTKIIENVHF